MTTHIAACYFMYAVPLFKGLTMHQKQPPANVAFSIYIPPSHSLYCIMREKLSTTF